MKKDELAADAIADQTDKLNQPSAKSTQSAVSNPPFEFLQHPWFHLALRVVLGGVFVYAGALKIADPLQFADSIASFELLPPQLINLVALGLPPFEILLGALLLIGPFHRRAAFAIFLLTLGFAGFLIQAIARGLQVDCGCFGSGEPSAWSAWISLGRAILLTAGSMILLRSRRARVTKL